MPVAVQETVSIKEGQEDEEVEEEVEDQEEEILQVCRTALGLREEEGQEEEAEEYKKITTPGP